MSQVPIALYSLVNSKTKIEPNQRKAAGIDFGTADALLSISAE